MILSFEETIMKKQSTYILLGAAIFIVLILVVSSYQPTSQVTSQGLIPITPNKAPSKPTVYLDKTQYAEGTVVKIKMLSDQYHDQYTLKPASILYFQVGISGTTTIPYLLIPKASRLTDTTYTYVATTQFTIPRDSKNITITVNAVDAANRFSEATTKYLGKSSIFTDIPRIIPIP